ncbi:hypothetical protein ACHQM5_017618 [Ranunculus cassubicifolius]
MSSRRKPSSMEDLEQIFKRFDTNGDGKISISELKSVITALGSEPSPTELQTMMAAIDTNGDGFIDLKEFSEFYLQSSGVDKEQELREAFDCYDKDKNGVISAAELHTVLKSLGEKVTVSDCKKMIKAVDVDGDGNVNFEEFKKMMGYSNK